MCDSPLERALTYKFTPIRLFLAIANAVFACKRFEIINKQVLVIGKIPDPKPNQWVAKGSKLIFHTKTSIGS
jgi:hypothetical protein